MNTIILESKSMKTVVLEHVLSICHNCLTPNSFNSANVSFLALQDLFRNSYCGDKITKPFDEAFTVFEYMRQQFFPGSDLLSEEYESYLKTLRDLLYKALDEFKNSVD